MKAMVMDGFESGGGTAQADYKAVEDELKSCGCEIESFRLRDLTIADCAGDFLCWMKTPGTCVVDDDNRKIARTMVNSDLHVVLTHITFGCYSSTLKKALDHLVQNINPFFRKFQGEVHHEPRYDRYPRYLAVGVLPQSDKESERIFQTLVHRNSINMYTPAYKAGVLYEHQSPDEMRQRIRGYLGEVGVRQ